MDHRHNSGHVEAPAQSCAASTPQEETGEAPPLHAIRGGRRVAEAGVTGARRFGKTFATMIMTYGSKKLYGKATHILQNKMIHLIALWFSIFLYRLKRFFAAVHNLNSSPPKLDNDTSRYALIRTAVHVRII